MKTIVTSFILAFAVLAVADGKPHGKLDPEARQRQLMEKVGGILVMPPQGSVVIFNQQDILPEEGVSGRAKFLSRMMGVPVNVQKSSAFSIGKAESILKENKANVGIFLVSDAALPLSLVAIEGPWVMLNMAKLAEGKPSQEVLQKRYNAELNRLVASLLGICGPGRGLGPRTQTINQWTAPKSGPDFDQLENIALSQDNVMAIHHNLAGWGVHPERKSTYKRACQLGWAPAPTNDYQKAVWEKVKAEKERGPANPITIPPPKKK